ncbi:MAG: sporulation protein Cse60 [Bacilli bacterium]|nr:sporulation protein Cse60 [Bacilli bacterium]
MKVKLFDENHEKDLEESINKFISDGIEIIDIKYQVAISVFSEEQIYCFSALVMYEEKNM